jgi:peptidoglycan/xylan/chitin deacetylase (PgdA/CDA1 family)
VVGALLAAGGAAGCGDGTGGRAGAVRGRQAMKEQAAAVKRPVIPAMRRINCARARCVALTFDDGPGDYTGALLNQLRSSRVRATFFLLGLEVPGRGHLVRRMVYEGHEVGNHTWSHKNLTTLTPAEIRDQVGRAQQVIQSAGGVAPKLFRPPYGATDERVGRIVGMPQIAWNVDTMDWSRVKTTKSKTVVEWARHAQPGGIILMHDIYPDTVKAVPKVVMELRRRGFTLVTVSELFQIRRLQPGVAYRHLW